MSRAPSFCPAIHPTTPFSLHHHRHPPPNPHSHQKMSHRQTLSLAHTAECKLKIAADKPDRNLRFILGHALTLDSLNLRLIQIEQDNRTVRQPRHAGSVTFKAAGGGSGSSPLAGRRKTPPPQAAPADIVPALEEDVDDDGAEDDEGASDEEEGLSLQRFPSASAQPPRQSPQPERVRALVDEHVEGSSSSEDEELESLLDMLTQNLRKGSTVKDITQTDADQNLSQLYNKVKGCPCHKEHVPDVKNFWEINSEQVSGLKGFEGMKFALAEIQV